MSISNDDPRVKRMNEYLNNLSKEEIEKINRQEIDRNKRDYENLKQHLKKSICCYCGNLLTHFSDKKPCLHWLLKPKGFKKKHFPLLYNVKSFHEIEAYLRWVANTEEFLVNINDLVEEKSSSKIIEETIRYKNLEWSFSCSPGDMAGHKDKFEGRMPHYHFQMKVDGFVMINYKGFHIPFHDYDDYCFAMKSGVFNKARHVHTHGASVQSLFDVLDAEMLLDNMNRKHIKDESKAPFKLNTLIFAEEGKTIPGEEIAKIMEEHKKTGIPLPKLARKLENVSVQTIITPGPGVPEISKRPQRS